MAKTLTREQQQIEDARNRVRQETAGHELVEIVIDQGVHRHLRFRGDGSFYWFDLITWPGVLVIDGDCGTFVFRRTNDMFEWFACDGMDRINPSYWAQKLQAPVGTQGVREFSREAYVHGVREYFDEYITNADDYEIDGEKLRQAVEEELINGLDYDDHIEAHTRLRDWSGAEGIHIEWGDGGPETDDWDWQYLWCCWAILRGITLYREHPGSAANEDEGHDLRTLRSGETIAAGPGDLINLETGDGLRVTAPTIADAQRQVNEIRAAYEATNGATS